MDTVSSLTLKSSFYSAVGTNVVFWLDFDLNTTLVIESFCRLLHMLSWCTSIGARGMIHYQLVLLQLDPPLDNGCPVPQLEPITSAGGRPACQMWGLLHALCDPSRNTDFTYTRMHVHRSPGSQTIKHLPAACDFAYDLLPEIYWRTWEAVLEMACRPLCFPSKPNSDLVVATDSPCGKQSPSRPCY